MKLETILQYTKEEGGQWLDWPFGQLNTPLPIMLMTPKLQVKARVWAVFEVAFHSVRLADGREWDSMNGWRALSNKHHPT